MIKRDIGLELIISFGCKAKYLPRYRKKQCTVGEKKEHSILFYNQIVSRDISEVPFGWESSFFLNMNAIFKINVACIIKIVPTVIFKRFM